MAVRRNLKVHTVLDVRTGKVSAARHLLNQMTEQEKHELRSKQLGSERILNYACPACDQKVYLSGSGFEGDKVYHFKHFPNAGDCPLKDGTSPSREDLLGMMYNGAKESDLHKDLKAWLGNFLKSIEHKGDFANTNIEKRITSQQGKLHWRQPDVSCAYRGKNLVFELQLNGTFVEVIQGREQFYQEEKTFICWLFDSFDPSNTDFGERDIFWLNKSNAFAITKEAMELSEREEELYVECHYIRPTAIDDEVVDLWEKDIIPFHSLTLTDGYYKPYYFDSDSERTRLTEKVVAAGFRDYLVGSERRQLARLDREAKDSQLVKRLKALRPGLEAPEELSVGFLNIVDAIKFLKEGCTTAQFHPTFNNIKNYTNQIIQFYPEFGHIFGKAVKTYRPGFKRDELGEKLKGKFEAFWGELMAAQKSGAPDKQNRSYDGIIAIIFPELKEYLTVLPELQPVG
jgi:competence CoiA-like predicted nuclease